MACFMQKEFYPCPENTVRGAGFTTHCGTCLRVLQMFFVYLGVVVYVRHFFDTQDTENLSLGVMIMYVTA